MFTESLMYPDFVQAEKPSSILRVDARQMGVSGCKMGKDRDVFLMIRRKKLTIFTDAKDTTSVHELKKIIEGILKVNPTNQQLFNKDNFVMEDDKTLQEYGLTSAIAKAQSPAVVGLAVRQENGDFEPLELTPYSSPPDLPDVMKSQESNGQEQLS
uniref:Elongin-B n=1 Tax=Timema tahoe TaxID=61484 RepID=A0A7R9NZ33_9NEOP|nr:unnamed protein product [Timema tahoe]